MLDSVTAWDARTFTALNHWLHVQARSTPEIDAALRAANELGNGWMLVVAAVGIIALENTFKRGFRRLMEVGLPALTSGYTGYLIKKAVNRPRPQKAMPEVFADGRAIAGFNEFLRSASFPSGHTALSFAVVTTFWW
ncbi:MAG: phosphatase PAP2 family protein, partial [Planctomycetota bacterium]